MADIRIGKLTLKLSGLSRPDSELLARRIAEGLAASDLQGAPNKIGSISTRVTAPGAGRTDALAEAVIADLVRTLERGI